MRCDIPIVYTDPSRIELGYARKCKLDMTIGDSSDDNDFVLHVPLGIAREVDTESIIYCEGTGFGGVVYGGSETSKVKGAGMLLGTSQTYTVTGNTVEGILFERPVDPDGIVNLVVEGDANECIAQILAACDDIEFIEAANEACGVHIKHTVDRFSYAYPAIRKMLKQNGLKLKVRKDPGKPFVLYAAPIEYYGDVDGQNRCEYKITWDTPYNGIIAAGTGEGLERATVRLFADEDKAISHKQTIFGLRARHYFYDYNNDDLEKLEEDAWKKLEGFQNVDTVRIELPPDRVFDVGDILRITSPMTGRMASAEIARTIVTIDESGMAKVTNEPGDPVWDGGEAWIAIRI